MAVCYTNMHLSFLTLTASRYVEIFILERREPGKGKKCNSKLLACDLMFISCWLTILKEKKLWTGNCENLVLVFVSIKWRDWTGESNSVFWTLKFSESKMKIWIHYTSNKPWLKGLGLSGNFHSIGIVVLKFSCK